MIARGKNSSMFVWSTSCMEKRSLDHHLAALAVTENAIDRGLEEQAVLAPLVLTRVAAVNVVKIYFKCH
jgi:hypothetical protein